MEIQDAYRQKLGAQLKEWSAAINLLEAKVANAAADVKVKRAEELHELRVQQRVASGKMRELAKASAEAWEEVKQSADRIWKELETGVASAQSKFK